MKKNNAIIVHPATIEEILLFLIHSLLSAISFIALRIALQIEQGPQTVNLCLMFSFPTAECIMKLGAMVMHTGHRNESCVLRMS